MNKTYLPETLSMKKVARHLLTVSDLSAKEIQQILAFAKKLKHNPERYLDLLKGHTMLMLFEKPSLRTRVSFEHGMTQLGGHSIFYSIADSPLGKKENIHDTAQCLTQYVDIIMARLNTKKSLDELAASSGIPVLNGLDDFGHPCQILSDLFTILEYKGTLKGIKVVYYGDCDNNVTYDLMRAVCISGGNMVVCGPSQHQAKQVVIDECSNFCKQSGGSIVITHNPEEAAKDADAIYTDSWMSYHIQQAEKQERINTFNPYKVTEKLMKLAKPDCIFMNCLPADRTMEQEAAVIDGPQSVVFPQAGNRLHVQKAITLFFLGKMPREIEGERLLVALGGNALIQPGQKGTYDEQKINARTASKQLADVVNQGYKLAVTHGNGPQVGAIYLQNQYSSDKVAEQPLYCCGAMSQGFIGYIFQNELQRALLEKNTQKTCASIITQCIVNKGDAAFKNPTKPVGRFYTETEAEEIRKQGYTVKEDSGRGYRIVVPSPIPTKIVEAQTIQCLYDNGIIPICNGGGGIPVIEEFDGKYVGVNAVIDKDLGGEVLAGTLGIDKFIILTDVDGVYLNYKKDNQKFLPTLSISECKEYLKKGEFGKGSMEPKVQAACKFVEKTGKTAIITSLNKLLCSLKGLSGTHIHP